MRPDLKHTFFFFNDTATTEIYTLSLHDALPISATITTNHSGRNRSCNITHAIAQDRKSTRLNSSHSQISYAVFCLKKKNQNTTSHLLHPPHHTHTAQPVASITSTLTALLMYE